MVQECTILLSLACPRIVAGFIQTFTILNETHVLVVRQLISLTKLIDRRFPYIYIYINTSWSTRLRLVRYQDLHHNFQMVIVTIKSSHLTKHLQIMRQFYKVILFSRAIGLMSRVFANGPGDSSIPGRVIPKTQKMVIDAALLNTQYYEVRIMGKVEQSSEWSSTVLYKSV